MGSRLHPPPKQNASVHTRIPLSFFFILFLSSLSLVFLGHMTGLAWPIFIQWVKGPVIITPPTPVGSTHPLSLSCTQHLYLSINACMSISIATVVARVGDEWSIKAGHDLPGCSTPDRPTHMFRWWQTSDGDPPEEPLWVRTCLSFSDTLTAPSSSFRDRPLYLCLLMWDCTSKDLLTSPVNLDTIAVVSSSNSTSSTNITLVIILLMCNITSATYTNACFHSTLHSFIQLFIHSFIVHFLPLVYAQTIIF